MSGYIELKDIAMTSEKVIFMEDIRKLERELYFPPFKFAEEPKKRKEQMIKCYKSLIQIKNKRSDVEKRMSIFKK